MEQSDKVISAGTLCQNPDSYCGSNSLVLDTPKIQAKRKKVDSLDCEAPSGTKKAKVQIFIKLEGRSLSLQEVLTDTTTKQLIELSCEKMRMKTPQNIYGVYCGERLKDGDYLSHLPRDSTIDLRSRLRAGQQVVSYVVKFTMPETDLFHTVVLPQSLVNNITSVKSVVKLKKYSRVNIKKVLVFFTGKHREGTCFNGAFESDHILFHDETVYLADGIQGTGFTGQGCRADYKKLREIFSTLRTQNGHYGQYFDHLLSYLDRCPAGELSRSEPAIAFLVNHPALEFYQDRISQIQLFDNMLFRVTSHLKTLLKAMGKTTKWWTKLENCPAMEKVLLRGSSLDAYGRVIYNSVFTNDTWGCLHYSNNYFKHASNNLTMEQLDAAYSLNLPVFLPNVLERITLHAINPANATFAQQFCQFLELISDNLYEYCDMSSWCGLHVSSSDCVVHFNPSHSSAPAYILRAIVILHQRSLVISFTPM